MQSTPRSVSIGFLGLRRALSFQLANTRRGPVGIVPKRPEIDQLLATCPKGQQGPPAAIACDRAGALPRAPGRATLSSRRKSEGASPRTSAPPLCGPQVTKLGAAILSPQGCGEQAPTEKKGAARRPAPASEGEIFTLLLLLLFQLGGGPSAPASFALAPPTWVKPILTDRPSAIASGAREHDRPAPPLRGRFGDPPRCGPGKKCSPVPDRMS